MSEHLISLDRRPRAHDPYADAWAKAHPRHFALCCCGWIGTDYRGDNALFRAHEDALNHQREVSE